MIDIHFYMKIYELKQKIMKGEPFDRDNLFNEFEKFRDKKPVIYNFMRFIMWITNIVF